MRTIISQITPEIASHCGEFEANHRQYAAAQGYEYHLYTERYYPTLWPTYSRIAYLQQELQAGADPLIYVDADIAFMDHTWDIGQLLNYGVIDTAHWERGVPWPVLGRSSGAWLAGYNQQNWPTPYLCAGLLVFRNTWITHSFLNEISKLIAERLACQDKDLGDWLDLEAEQGLINKVLGAMGYAGVRLCSHSEIGGFCRQLWHDDTWYEPGDPTIHFGCHGDWATRRKLLVTQYLSQVRR